MNVGGFYTPVIVDLSGLKASRDKIPILLGHNDAQIIGQTDSIAIDSAGVRLTGVITGEDVHAASVVTHAKNGFEWQASIGASIVRQEFVKAGEKAVVNSREVTGPILIARESRLFETSFVAIGADQQTSASVAASSSPGLPSKEPSMFEKWLEAKGVSPDSLDDNTRKVLEAAYNAEQAAKEKPATPSSTQTLDEVIEARRKEDERVNQITKLATSAIDERPALISDVERLARAAIENKSTVQEFELALLRLMRPVLGSARPRTSGPQIGPKMIEAAICISGRLENVEKAFDQQTLNAASDRFPHGLGLRDLLLMAARENGYTGPTSNDVRALLQAAFEDKTIRASDFSTLSLPGILSNVANKFLNQGFNAVESGWRDISATRSVRDFKTVTSYTLTGGMVYEKVGPSGELKHGSVSELSYTNRAETYGRMFAITRTDIINDDLGALTQIPMKLGRGAALKLNAVFWTEFLADLNTFYTSGRGNVSTGAGSALSSAGLTAAQLKFRKQTDADSLPLGISPSILLVPPELEVTANELMTSLIVNTGGSSTTDKVPNRNVWGNKYSVTVASYLSNSSYTGYSTAAWWLIANPMDLPLIEVAFLNGRDTPVVESADADFNVLGIQMRGYHDFGVAKQEYRAAVRSAGS